MKNFSDYPLSYKSYGGINGKKLCAVIDGEFYMIKFPFSDDIRTHTEFSIYSNDCICEYLGCHIFSMVGIPAQETELGTYTVGSRDVVVVACKDFTSGDAELLDFHSRKNAALSSPTSGHGTELSDIDEILQFGDNGLSNAAIRERFWDMFIVDALIANPDRHNGNWGFLLNRSKNILSLAPVYDCGAALWPSYGYKDMKNILESENLQNYLVFTSPYSIHEINGQRINYFDFISSLENEQCNEALKRIVPRIDMDRIDAMIDEIPCITDVHKSFYKMMLHKRKELILDFSLEKLQKREKSLSKSRKSRGAER